MSAPLVVNTKDGTVWTRRAATHAGAPLYSMAGVDCPEMVMATLSELAEHGIVGSADVLPVPVGPQMPEFPPPPRTELEILHAERARLQGLLAEAVADAHRARRERDLMRERVSEPFGCQHCGTAKRSHGRRYLGGVGMHAWERPTDEQVKGRMLARRAARMPLDVERLRARVAELLAERHTTNEALDDAVQELRARRGEEPTTDTLPAWLHWRFGPHGQRWDSLDADDQSYWEHHAEAVRRAVARNGFKQGGNDAALALGADVPPLRGRALLDALTVERAERTHKQRLGVEDPHDSPLHHPYRVSRDLPETGGAR